MAAAKTYTTVEVEEIVARRTDALRVQVEAEQIKVAELRGVLENLLSAAIPAHLALTNANGAQERGAWKIAADRLMNRMRQAEVALAAAKGEG